MRLACSADLRYGGGVMTEPHFQPVANTPGARPEMGGMPASPKRSVVEIRIADSPQVQEALTEATRTIARLAAERDRYRAALVEALEEMVDMRSYVPTYYAEKWGHDAAIEAVRSVLEDTPSKEECL